MSSINFNASASVALQTLTNINKDLSTLNDQISTGKKVNNAKDNAAIYSIATTISADVAGFNKVSESLGFASSTLGVARNATETIVSLLEDAQGLIVDAQTKSAADRTTIQADIDNLKTQIQDIVEAASFNGTNLVDGSQGGNISFLSSLNRTSAGISTDTITVNTQNLDQSTRAAGTATVAGNTQKATVNLQGTDVVGATNVAGDAGLAAAGSETITFSSQTIATGDTFRLQLDVTASATAIDVNYIANEGDTSNDVVQGLANALREALAVAEQEDPTFDSSLVTVATSTSSDPTNNDVSLSITNGTASAFNAATTYTETTGGDAGGLLGELANIDVATSDTSASNALNSIDDLLGAAIDAAAAFGQAQKRIDTQSSFITSLVSNLNQGISSLTDADLTAASARLSQVQVQQQLGLQALGIANQAPQSILALFR